MGKVDAMNEKDMRIESAAIMHLEDNMTKGNDSTVSTAKAVEAGAPVVRESVRLALEGVFLDWLAENSHLIDYASSPDVVGLLFRLNAAFTKELSSSCEISKASRNTSAALATI
jgi:hypothetical protein